MKQLFFGPPDLPRFGILHLPPSGEVGDTGVVIAPPFANEYFRSYRSLKVLADRIAKLGYPVFRFELTGTGDAGGDDFDMSLARWREDLAAALEQLRLETGVSRFHLVGRRLGAALCLEVADRPEVDRVVLWDPIRTGKAYLEEMKEEHREFVGMYRGVHGSIREAEGSDFAFEALGQCFTEALVQDFQGWDPLGERDLSAVSALLLDTTVDGAGKAYADQLEAAGASVEYQTPSDPSAKDPTNPIRVYLPNKVLRAITDGLAPVAS